MVLSHKGGGLCVKNVFAKKILVPGEIPFAPRAQTSMKRPLIAWLSLGERTSSWICQLRRRRCFAVQGGFNAPLPDDGVLTTGRRNFFNMPHEPSLRISVH
jgi:hypothetical protein